MAKRRSKRAKRGSKRRGTGGSRTYRSKGGSVYKLTKVASGLKTHRRRKARKARKSRRGRRR